MSYSPKERPIMNALSLPVASSNLKLAKTCPSAFPPHGPRSSTHLCDTHVSQHHAKNDSSIQRLSHALHLDHTLANTTTNLCSYQLTGTVKKHHYDIKFPGSVCTHLARWHSHSSLSLIQPQNDSLQHWGDNTPDWRQKKETMGRCNNGTGWNKTQCMCLAASPTVHTLPMWNHLMHVLLLTLVSHNWGRGLVQSPPRSAWKGRFLIFEGYSHMTRFYFKVLCTARSGGEGVRGCKHGWAADVSVGGMQGMNEISNTQHRTPCTFQEIRELRFICIRDLRHKPEMPSHRHPWLHLRRNCCHTQIFTILSKHMCLSEVGPWWGNTCALIVFPPPVNPFAF